MRPMMKSLINMRLYPLYSQLGVRVDLEGSLVVVDSMMRSLRLKVLMMRLMHLEFSKVRSYALGCTTYTAFISAKSLGYVKLRGSCILG